MPLLQLKIQFVLCVQMNKIQHPAFISLEMQEVQNRDNLDIVQK